MAVREDIERDRELLARVRGAEATVPIDARSMHVKVNDGVVILSGVTSARKLPELLSAIRHLDGVKDVISELRVNQDTTEMH